MQNVDSKDKPNSTPMKFPIFQVDAFTDSIFGGNPAAVVPLNSWLADETMQRVAMENNLSETAFYVEEHEAFGLRWFTRRLRLIYADTPR